MASGSDDSNPIYGNVDAVFFHHLVTTGGLIGDAINAEDFDDDIDDFSSDEEETEDTDSQERTSHEHNQQEEDTRRIQENNIQGNTCNEEENYLNPYPPSTQNVPSWRQMKSSPWLPQSTTPNVSNPVPWRSPPSGKINSQDNGGNSNPSPLDHSKRGPVPLPTQKLDFRSKRTNYEQAFQDKEENTQKVQKKNMKGVTYNEDNYVDVQPLSSQNVPSWTQMRSSPQPPQSTTPSNVSSPVPWQSPPSGKMNSPHNGRNSNLPPLDHSKRGPMQLPTQKLDFRNKILPQPPDSSLRQDLSTRNADNPQFPRTKPQDPIETADFPVMPKSFQSPQQFSHTSLGNNLNDSFTAEQLQLPGTVMTNTPVKTFPSGIKAFPPERNGPPDFPPPVPHAKLENGENIVLTPLCQSIMDKPYFHLLSRETAKTMVMKGGAGTFLIRPSTQSSKPLTITVNGGQKVFHINIRQRPDNLFALGNPRDNEMAFTSIDDAVTFYSKTPMVLSHGSEVMMKYSPLKTGNAYVHHSLPGRRGN